MPPLRGKTAILLSYLQILTQSEQLQSKMQQLEQAVAQGSLQLVADLSFQCRDLLSQLDNLPSLHLMRARIDEATLSTSPPPSYTNSSSFVRSPANFVRVTVAPHRHPRARRQRLEGCLRKRQRGGREAGCPSVV